jgi:hypothetical protein
VRPAATGALAHWSASTRHVVSKGSSKVASSPSCFPGMSSARTDSAFCHRAASAATSRIRRVSTATGVSPARGMQSSPVPQTLE